MPALLAPPRRTIPIRAVGAPPPEPGAPPKVDYNAVVQRYSDKVNNRASAIRAFCVTCCCGVLSEVRECRVTKCPLYLFRNGDDPYRKKRTDGFGGKQSEAEGEEE